MAAIHARGRAIDGYALTLRVSGVRPPCPGGSQVTIHARERGWVAKKTTAAFIIGFYLIIVLALTIGLLVGAPSWIIGAGVFVAGVPFAIWLMLRSGRTMRKSLEDPGESR